MTRNRTHRFVPTLAAVAVAISAGTAVAGHTNARAGMLGAPGPDWLQALMARSDAINHEYGLGEYARRTARTSATPDWLAALNARGDALNKQYGLGTYAPKR